MVLILWPCSRVSWVTLLLSILGMLDSIEELGLLLNVPFRFISLQHDLFEIEVDLAVGYTIDAALNNDPKFNVCYCTFSSYALRLIPSTAATHRQVHGIPRRHYLQGDEQEHDVPLPKPYSRWS